MSAFSGLSILFSICVSVFRASMNSTESQQFPSLISAMAYGSSEEHIANNTTISLGWHRHSRASQLKHLNKSEKDLSDSSNASHLYNKLDKVTSNEASESNSHSQFVGNQLEQTQDTETRFGAFTSIMTSTVPSGHLHSQILSVNVLSAVSRQVSSPAHVGDISSSRNNSISGNNSSPAHVGDISSFRNNSVSGNNSSPAHAGDISSSRNNSVSGNTSRHPGRAVPVFPGLGQQVKIGLNATQVQQKRLPKAIIIGAKKAGTRALLEFLRIHPNVEGTGPEPHFFDRNYEKGLEWYRDLMPVTQSHQITIEKTPGYFVTRSAPKRIFQMDPSMKLILVVRDPVTRAISDYCQAVSKRSMKSFEEMALLNDRLGLVNMSWGAIRIGVYAKHMEHWLQVFSLRQIHLVDGQKLIQEPASEVSKVEAFLGLPKYINASHFFLRGFKNTFPCLVKEGKPHCLDVKTKGRDHPVVKESVLTRLRDFYRPFNAKFYQMVRRYFQWS